MGKTLLLLVAASAALGAGVAYAGMGSRDIYTDGSRVMGPRDVYTDGSSVMGPRDPYSDGSAKFDVFSDGAKVVDRRDVYTDGGRIITRDGRVDDRM